MNFVISFQIKALCTFLPQDYLENTENTLDTETINPFMMERKYFKISNSLNTINQKNRADGSTIAS